MAYPEVPREIRLELEGRRTSAAAAFQLQQWKIAWRSLDDTYTYLLEQQERFRTRFHKGWELHNGGMALFKSTPKPEEQVTHSRAVAGAHPSCYGAVGCYNSTKLRGR